MPVTPPILGEDIRQWGRQLNLFLTRNLGKLYFKTSDDNPSENGIFLWDDDKNYPVVSAQNEFKQIAMKQTTPPNSIGVAGNVPGMLAWDANYIYVCTADYDVTTNIWKRAALSAY